MRLGTIGASMRYPHSFVETVRDEYPDRQEVVLAAEEGRYGLGVLLARGAAMSMSYEDIVSSIDSGDCRQVREDAARAVRRRRLHAEWMRIVLKSLSEACESQSVPPPSFRRRPSLSRYPGPSESVHP